MKNLELFAGVKPTKKRLFLPKLNIPLGFPHSPCISPVETYIIERYLEKDANEHHTFFNNMKFHNHLTYMLLANYSLGATVERLDEVYKQEEKKQRPKLEKHDSFVWSDHLGDENYYSDYLDFMIDEIDKLGSIKAIEKYAFNEEYDMLSRLLHGIYHPFIHTGYGVEFGIDGIVAEGLAQICVHSNSSKPLFPKDDLQSEKISNLTITNNSKSALQIAMEIIDDTRFNGIISFNDPSKYKTLLEKKPELVLEYVNKWSLPSNTEDLLNKALELIILDVALFAGTQRAGKETVLDFYLMHSFTSSLFLSSMIKSLNPVLGAKLLRGKFAVDLAFYISVNRPVINMEQYNTNKEFMKPWSEIFELSIKNEDEHLSKVIRALKQVERLDLEEIFGKGVYRAIASKTVEYFENNKEKKDSELWNFDGIGFDQVWENIPYRKETN